MWQTVTLPISCHQIQTLEADQLAVRNSIGRLKELDSRSRRDQRDGAMEFATKTLSFTGGAGTVCGGLDPPGFRKVDLHDLCLRNNVQHLETNACSLFGLREASDEARRHHLEAGARVQERGCSMQQAKLKTVKC